MGMLNNWTRVLMLEVKGLKDTILYRWFLENPNMGILRRSPKDPGRVNVLQMDGNGFQN
jgi:hypothetical protein